MGLLGGSQPDSETLPAASTNGVTSSAHRVPGTARLTPSSGTPKRLSSTLERYRGRQSGCSSRIPNLPSLPSTRPATCGSAEFLNPTGDTLTPSPLDILEPTRYKLNSINSPAAIDARKSSVVERVFFGPDE